MDADVIVLGPGSLYTSIVPNLLITGIRKAIEHSKARVVVALNLMSQPGETDGMNAAEHLQALEKHVGKMADTVLVNARRPPESLLQRYDFAGSAWLEADRDAVESMGWQLVEEDLLTDDDELIRHDPQKLARAVLRLVDG